MAYVGPCSLLRGPGPAQTATDETGEHDMSSAEVDAGMPPATSGQRITWEEVPDPVRAGIEKLIGDRVIAAHSQPGGFSEGVAARLRLAGGGRVFVKAAGAVAAPSAVGFHRREAEITGRLPAGTPTPRLLGTYDDGEWVALLFDEIDGRLPAQPWQPDEFEQVKTAVLVLSELMTPTPVTALDAAPRLGGWGDLVAAGNAGKLAAVSPWAADHLAELLALEERGPEAVRGDTLLHGDLYPFNVMIGGGGVHVIDWPHAWVGAPHCDLVTLLSSAALSGVDPQEHADAHPLTRDLDPVVLDATLALHAGFLLHRATSLPPTVDRNLVGMMRSLGLASVDWLSRRSSSCQSGSRRGSPRGTPR
jgi:hypothetical protein